MGVLNRRDVFTSKFPTALIIDSSNRAFFVPIKKVLGGNYFLVELEKQLYAFKLDGSRILTYRHKLSKTFNLYIYSTDHYLPISPNTNELSDILKTHNLPKINNHLLTFFRFLSLKETKKEDFTPHDVTEFVSKLKDDSDPVVQNLVTYLDSLGITQIVTPLRKISEFLESDLLTTDSKFLGNIVLTLTGLDYEHKKVTNTPITGKTPFVKFLAVMMGIGLVIGLLYFGYEQGVFDRLLDSVPSLDSSSNLLTGSGSESESELILQKYPDPLDLKIAIDNGEIDYDSLPQDIQNLIDGVELPDVISEPAPESTPEPAPESTPKNESTIPDEKSPNEEAISTIKETLRSFN